MEGLKILTHEWYSHFIVDEWDVKDHSAEDKHCCVEIFDGWIVNDGPNY